MSDTTDGLVELLLNDEPLYLATRNEDGREIESQVYEATQNPATCKTICHQLLGRVDWYQVARRMDES